MLQELEAKQKITQCWEVDERDVCREVPNPTTINMGEEFYIIGDKHKWGVHSTAQQHDCYTVLYSGKRFKALAKTVDRAIA